MYCNKGIPQDYLRSKYRRLLFLLQKYITYEGNFGLDFLFHICLLDHFRYKPLNLPYYLRMSLLKIVISTKERVAHIEENLYHHSLVKIIMTKVLKRQNKTWEDFLVENYFVDDEKEPDLPETKEAEPVERPRKKPWTCSQLT